MNRAFSLVELSIVLVILGLLTGGILAGQSLIRAAELRAVSTEYNRFVTASQSFRDKYFALPGDMANATSFWGAADPTPATCLTTAGTGTQTCNGNGNGMVDAAAAANQYGERFTFWQHLANAGLIEGSYTGRSGPLTTEDTSVTNAPRGKIGNSLWIMANDASSGGAMFPIAVARHNFRIGAPNPGSWPSVLILKPEEMWNIDSKMDDGKPGLGKVTAPLSSYIGAPDCATSDTPSSAEYELAINGNQCFGIFAAGI